MRKHTPTKPRLLALALHTALLGLPTVGSLSLLSQAAHAQSAPAIYSFDIPAGPLSTALTHIAAQAEVQLTANAELTAGKSAPAIKGDMSLNQALERVLAGSGLEASAQPDSGYYSLRKVAAFASAPAQAQSETELPAIAVEADRGAVLHRAERSIAREPRDLFAAEAEVEIGGGDRQGRRLHLRGVEGSNVNITVDGARQGQSLYNHRGGMPGVDPAILKRVDVRPGPAAADDGAGALGGSIRFETVDAQDLLRQGERFGAFVNAGYGSAAQSKTLNTALYGQPLDGVGLLAYLGGTDADLMRIGGGAEVPFSSYDDRNYLLKASLLNKGDHSLRLGHERNTTQGINFHQRGDYPWQLQPPAATRPPRDQTLTRENTTLNYRWNPASALLDVEAKLYQSQNEWDSPNNFGERFVSEGRGGTLKNTFAFALGSAKNRLSVGVDYLEDDGAAYGNRLPNKPLASSYHNTGVFVQNRVSVEALTLSFGVRRDSFETLYGTRRVEDAATSANLGGSYAINRQLEVFAGYGESARGWGTIPIQFARNIVANPVVPARPETAKQHELGLRYQGDAAGLWGGKPHGEVILFKNRIEDFIIYTHGGTGGLGGRPVTAITNQAAPIEFEGYTLRGGWQRDAFKTSLAFNHTRTHNLPAQPQHYARAGAPSGDKLVWDMAYQIVPAWSLGYTLIHVGHLNSSTTSTGIGQAATALAARPGYTVHDVQLEWQMTRDLTLRLAVQNLFDKRYANQTTLMERGFATEEPGRDVRIALRYRF